MNLDALHSGLYRKSNAMMVNIKHKYEFLDVAFLTYVSRSDFRGSSLLHYRKARSNLHYYVK